MINITDSGATIKLEITANYLLNGKTILAQIRFIPKSKFEVKSAGTIVSIFDTASAEHSEEFRFLFSDITTPTGVDAATIAGLIEAFQDSAPGPAGTATSANQTTEIARLDTLVAKDYATQTTLAALLAKVIAAPSTEAKQDAANTLLTTISNKDFATQTTLAALLAKVIAAPSTEAKQDTGNTALNDILAELRDDTFTTSFLWEDGSVTPHVFYREDRVKNQDTGAIATVYTRLSDNTIVVSLPVGSYPVSANSSKKVEFYRYIAIASGTGYTAGDWLTNTVIFDTDSNTMVSNTWYNLSTSAAISAPSFANIKDPEYDNALEATQLAILAKIITSPATEAKQDNQITQETALNTVIGIKADLPAADDTGVYTLLSFVKRQCQAFADMVISLTALKNFVTVPTNVVSVIESNALVLKMEPGQLISITGYSKGAGTQYLQVHNLSDLGSLVTGVVPVITIPVDDLGTAEAVAFSLEYNKKFSFSVGIIVAVSTTGNSFTAAGTGNWFTAQIN